MSSQSACAEPATVSASGGRCWAKDRRCSLRLTEMPVLLRLIVIPVACGHRLISVPNRLESPNLEYKPIPEKIVTIANRARLHPVERQTESTSRPHICTLFLYTSESRHAH